MDNPETYYSTRFHSKIFAKSRTNFFPSNLFELIVKYTDLSDAHVLLM